MASNFIEIVSIIEISDPFKEMLTKASDGNDEIGLAAIKKAAETILNMHFTDNVTSRVIQTDVKFK